jgi:hypothetical protein
MISEHDFSGGYSSLWHSLSPMSDGYWKVENMLVARALPPLASKSEVRMRGVVNEAAFRAFCELQNENSPVDRARALLAVDSNAAAAVDYVSRLTTRFKPEHSDFDEQCRRESAHLSLRLLHYFPGSKGTTLRPKFKGCGLLSACEGDLIEGDCLYEIKAGDRAFRITDLRQLLVYSALAYSAGELNFSRIGLFNPRTGSAWARSLDQVCSAIAGVKAADALSSLVGTFSAASVSR